jgi:CspA family cold shock protein
MRTTGTVREFDAEEGWGVIDTPVTPGGCWVHFSAINMAGYRTLATGGIVILDVEPAHQDGYVYRAVDVWPAGVEPGPRPEPVADGSGAYRSRLVVTNDAGTVVFDGT